MPFANEHASRLINPKELESRTGFEGVRRTHGSGKGKVQGVIIPHTIDVIWYVYKDGTVIAQTLRFPITDWTSTEALKWLKDNKIKYLSFEKAVNGKEFQEEEKKNFQTKIADIDEHGVVSIYVNGYNNIDSDNDISLPGCFEKTCRERFKQIKHLKDHDRTQLLGLPLEFITNDPYGLLVRSKMNLEKQFVKDVYSDYKFFAQHDRTLEHSIGYRAIKFSIDETSQIRKISEYKLLEYSTLSFLGANSNTPCVGIKGEAITGLKDEMQLLDEMLRKGDYSDEKFLQIENKLKEIQNKIEEMKTLNVTEPLEDTQPIVEPDTLFKSKIDYINIINNIKI
jgi:HK97 family phage prohead protease